MSHHAMTVIEIRPHAWGWKVFEASGVVPVFPQKDQAVDYVENRACAKSRRRDAADREQMAGTNHNAATITLRAGSNSRPLFSTPDDRYTFSDTPFTGKVIQVDPSGRQTEIASGLFFTMFWSRAFSGSFMPP
jgi:hypothetical protein